MNNKRQMGQMIEVVAAAVVSSGDGVLQGALFGIAATDAAIGDTVNIDTMGVFELPKATGSAWTVGAQIYWDDTNSRCTTASSGNTLVGCAVAAAASGDTLGLVRLDGATR